MRRKRAYRIRPTAEERARGQVGHIATPEERSAYYDALLPEFEHIAWEHGYALARHGSWRNDMDLIAVPWIENASPGRALAEAIARACIGWVSRRGSPEENFVKGDPGAKPHGRLVWTIMTWPDRRVHWGTYIDLSIMPRINPIEEREP